MRKIGHELQIKNKKSPVSDSENISHIVHFIEVEPNKSFSVNKLCNDFKIKRRVLYDFVSILSEFGCCTKIYAEKFEWFGLSALNKKINDMKATFDKESRILKDNQIRDSFDCVTNTSLPQIAVCIIKLFFYLNVKTLDLREACKFFVMKDPAKYNTLLRKMYTVSSRLKVVGILSETLNTAEIHLCNFESQANNDSSNSRNVKINNLINTDQELKIEQIYSQRRKEFESFQKPGSNGSSFASSSSSSSSTSTSKQPSSPESGIATAT